jgi:RNA ligase (TIGR02306 family)
MENLFEEGADGPEKSEFQVIVVKIGKIEKHPGADTLSIVDVDGYPCIIKTGTFKEGDLAVYVPVDALVPVAREEFKFLAKPDRPDFTHHRVKAARLRGIFSMGLLVATCQKVEQSIEVQPGLYATIKVGQNVQQLLGIEKWVAPEERKALAHEARTEAQKRARVNKGPKLPIYGLDPLRRYGQSLPFGTQVVISEKIHGCNARFVFNNGRLWVGSHKAMRGCSRNRIGEFFERLKIKLMSLLGIGHRAHTLAELGDIWWQVAQEYKLKERLATKPNMVLYGEIYGEGVQFLTYDSPKGRKLRIFDIYDLDKKRFLDYTDFVNAGVDMGFDPVKDFVPYLYTGPWTEEVKDLYLKHCQHRPFCSQ